MMRLLVPVLLLLTACATGGGRVAGRGEGGGDTQIGFGRTTAGRLTPDAPRFADGSHYRPFPFVGRAGDTITAELESIDFDANLILTDGLGNRIAANDDGGEHCNARLTHVLPQDGRYRLYANSSATAELGAFHLALRRGGSVAPADTICRGFGRVTGMIQIGETVEGTLTTDDAMFTSDSTYFQRWVIPVTPGQPFTVDLTSDDFDAYVLLTWGGGDKVLENDDGGGACNARLVYTPADDRPLRILANTARQHETGRYVLRVTAGRAAVDPKGQCFDGS
jgi:hypothetical protein